MKQKAENKTGWRMALKAAVKSKRKNSYKWRTSSQAWWAAGGYQLKQVYTTSHCAEGTENLAEHSCRSLPTLTISQTNIIMLHQHHLSGQAYLNIT